MRFIKTFFLVIPFLLNGCLSLPTLQTGKTVGKNNFDVSVNGSYGKYSQNSILDLEGNFDYKPVIGIRGNYGLTEKFDIGFNLDQTSFLGPSLKYQILGNQNSLFATSIGVEGGFLIGSFLFGSFTNYVTAPLFISVHPSDHIAIYVTPRFIHTSEYVFAHPTGGETGAGLSLNTFGSSYGLVLGTKHKIAVELSNYGSHFYKPTQLSVGYIFSYRK